MFSSASFLPRRFPFSSPFPTATILSLFFPSPARLFLPTLPPASRLGKAYLEPYLSPSASWLPGTSFAIAGAGALASTNANMVGRASTIAVSQSLRQAGREASGQARRHCPAGDGKRMHSSWLMYGVVGQAVVCT